jgi:hypothetical protein
MYVEICTAAKLPKLRLWVVIGLSLGCIAQRIICGLYGLEPGSVATLVRMML